MQLDDSDEELRDPNQRVRQLIQHFGEGAQCVAWHLCDRHDPASLAYRIIGSDLGASDLTYGQLKSESERLAAGFLALGLQPGDRIATLMGKSRDYLVTLMAIWRIGAVHLPLFTAFAPAAVAYRLEQANARLVVCDGNQIDKLQPGPDMPRDAGWQVATNAPGLTQVMQISALMSSGDHVTVASLSGDAPLIHIFTSGTTGKPKGLVVPVRALAAIQTYMEFALNLGPDDVYWCGADPGWAYGLYYGVVGSFLTGTPSVLLEGGFSPAATQAVLCEQRVTNFTAAPTVYRAMRAANTAPTQGLVLRCASSAGEPLTPDVNDWACRQLGVPVHDHFGQTETGMVINNHHHPALREQMKPGSMGRAMPGWTAVVLQEKADEEAKPSEVGRVAVRLAESPLAWFSGYIGAQDRTAERFTANGEYYLTGDTGWVDADGDFHFSARDDDVILMAGYRIGPGEIENVICMHEAVTECGVIAVPDPIRGEVMEAFVRLRDGLAGDVILAEELRQWVKARYAAHAYPRAVHFVSSLPRTPSGKLQRGVLKQQRLSQIAGVNP